MVIKKKFYEDYNKKDRLPEYRRVLQNAKDNGYIMVGVLDFYKMVQSPEKLRGTKILLNRHDIDTSPRTAAIMFEIEKEVYGQSGSATYYFRNSTIDKKLIAAIDSFGYETGYHYEELATYEKKYKLKSKEKLLESLPEMRKQFLTDLDWYRKETGSKSLSVSSHGDFINTRYGLQSYEILKDNQTRENARITVEAYDRIVMDFIEERYADHILLSSFPDKVIESIKRGCSYIMLLTHPRNWKVDVIANTKENIKRLIQDVKYRL